MSNNINKELPVVEGPIRGEPELVQKQVEKKKKQKEQAKEMFQTEVIDGRIYFNFKGQNYYIESGLRENGDELLDFKMSRTLKHLSKNIPSMSQAKKIIRDRVDLFPPDMYIVSYTYRGNERIENVKHVTSEQEDIILDCYDKRIYDIETIKKKLKLSDSVQLVLEDGISAIDFLNNTAEQRALAEMLEWGQILCVYYADGEKQNQRVFNEYEEYLKYKDGVDFSEAVQKATRESVAKNKKK